MLKLTPCVLLLIIAACNEGLTPPPVDPIASIAVEPGPVYLVPGDTFRLRAVARRVNGEIMGDRGYEWVSSTSGGLEVLDDGRVVAMSASKTTVTARAEGAEGSTSVQVCGDWAAYPGTRFVPHIYSGWFEGARLDGSDVLFKGGVVYGTSPEDLIVGNDFTGTLPRRMQLGGICKIRLPTGDYTRTVAATYTYPASSVPTKVRLEQESFSAFGDQRARVILMRYTFTNITNRRVNGLRVALNLDWDLTRNNGSGSDDHSTFASHLGAEIVTDASGTTVGMVGLDAPIVTYKSYGSQDANNTIPRTTALLFESMTGGISPPRPGPTDVMDMMAYAPMTLAVGESRSITLAMIAAESREEFEKSLQVARELMSSFPRKLQAP